MADLLVLSWDRRRLSGIELTPGGSTPRIHSGFNVDWPEQGPTANWLRETLRRFNVNARQVALALPREDVVLRLLELPQVSDDEMPTLVRFQAAARSAQSLDQLLLDYLPLPVRPGVAQREVWLATTPLTTVDPIRALLSEAGLELVQLSLSSLSLTELIARGEAKQSIDPAEASLVVLREGPRMELAVVCQRQLIAAHAVKWSSVNDIPPPAKMLAEVSRLLVQVQAWLPEGTLQRVWVIGSDEDVGELPVAIAERWNCPVQRFDPWRDGTISIGSAKVEGPSTEYAIAAGLALTQSSRLAPKIDLLHPRQPPPKRDPRKPYIAAAAAAALVVVATGTAVIQQSLASYDRAIEELRLQEEDIKAKLKEGAPVLDASKTIDDWQSRNINQLSQMAELYDVMKGTQKLVVSEYRSASGSGPVLAKLHTAGIARDREDAAQFAQHLADNPKYVVRPTAGTGASHDHEYVSRFDLDVDLVPVKKKLAAAKPAATPTAKIPGK